MPIGASFLGAAEAQSREKVGRKGPRTAALGVLVAALPCATNHRHTCAAATAVPAWRLLMKPQSPQSHHDTHVGRIAVNSPPLDRATSSPVNIKGGSSSSPARHWRWCLSLRFDRGFGCAPRQPTLPTPIHHLLTASRALTRCLSFMCAGASVDALPSPSAGRGAR